MSTFSVPIKRIRAVEPHPNADAIELAVIDGYRSVVKKGQFKAGDLTAYIPEAAVLPQWLLERLGMWDAEQGIGKLNGPAGNRVKAVRLRGELSLGICYPVIRQTGYMPGDFIRLQDEYEDGATLTEVVHPVAEGDNVAELLGITKYVPDLPAELIGEAYTPAFDLTLRFDVESWKSYPDILQAGEEVVFTEKLHGLCTIVAILPLEHAHPNAFGEKQNILISTKGMFGDGYAFINNEENSDSPYMRATRKLVERIDELQREYGKGPTVPEYILGETFGPGVQDLAYGKELGFRVFAAAQGYRGSSQSFYDWDEVVRYLQPTYRFETVPVLYRGPFSEEVMREYTDGKTAMDAKHIREGIVMVPAEERVDSRLDLGRVCLKSVSADYLTRKGGTEYS